MSRGKPVWALFAALAAALLALQLFTHTAPMAFAHEREATTSQGEALVCDDAHGPEETSQHFLTRDRQRSDENASVGASSGAQTVGAHVAAASSMPSTAGHTYRQPRPATGLSPAGLQIFRC
ncbi:hypothetical protein SMIR_41335 (plasmid) [Streptomyces mirabilis]|uniref:hypothetical protein n=1 Tax=Streptomyces mirabilis TaxID=68239 RepID=UPI001BAE8F2B|nr:hypothetical protein [Streptomyces mirabilis]QUW85517.1 hypothetical protein SMIR_41335 [Streptomyces mirabilis]